MKWAISLFVSMLSIVISVTFSISYHQENVKAQQKKNIALEESIVSHELHPELAAKRDRIIRRARQRGIDIVITAEYRTVEEQNELYAQGRTAEGPVVTTLQGGDSYHNYGLAFDFAVLDENGNQHWDIDQDSNGNGKSDWEEVGQIGKDLGLEWGGDWEDFPDFPHFQETFGWTISDLKQAQE